MSSDKFGTDQQEPARSSYTMFQPTDFPPYSAPNLNNQQSLWTPPLGFVPNFPPPAVSLSRYLPFANTSYSDQASENKQTYPNSHGLFPCLVASSSDGVSVNSASYSRTSWEGQQTCLPSTQPSLMKRSYTQETLTNASQYASSSFQEFKTFASAQERNGSFEMQNLELDDTSLKKWLQTKKSDSKASPNEKQTQMHLKLVEARQYFKDCLSLLQELTGLHKQLTAQCEFLSPELWQEMSQQVTEKKNLINKYQNKLNDPSNLESLKKTLAKRSKKRAAQKRRKCEHRMKVKETLVKRQQLHKNIDAWLKDMEKSVEKSRREESLKLEADLVLSEVTRKKAEAKKQMTLLSNLLKLRHLRSQAASSKGEQVSAEAGACFEKVIENLQEMWMEQLKGYAVEEQGLRVMLEDAVEERYKSEDNQEKRTLRSWEKTLFGDKSWGSGTTGAFTRASRDLDAFVATRRSWDKFVVQAGTPMASAIPPGWVLPVKPSSQQWEKLLAVVNTDPVYTSQM